MYAFVKDQTWSTLLHKQKIKQKVIYLYHIWQHSIIKQQTVNRLISNGCAHHAGIKKSISTKDVSQVTKVSQNDKITEIEYRLVVTWGEGWWQGVDEHGYKRMAGQRSQWWLNNFVPWLQWNQHCRNLNLWLKDMSLCIYCTIGNSLAWIMYCDAWTIRPLGEIDNFLFQCLNILYSSFISLARCIQRYVSPQTKWQTLRK